MRDALRDGMRELQAHLLTEKFQGDDKGWISVRDVDAWMRSIADRGGQAGLGEG